jgi:rhodanese-related sulfurtransferase
VKRRDEIHYRINKRQLYELYNEYEYADEEQFSRENNDLNASDGGEGRITPRIVTHCMEDLPSYEKPYLLLDARPVDQYNVGHLMQARSYPYTMIRRDFMHPDIYKFKNVENNLIIVYCDDERISRDVSKTLVDRGVDNVFLLTGGMNEFSLEYPSFVEGKVPSLPSPPQRPKPFEFLRTIGEDREEEVGGDHVFMRSPLTARSNATSRRSQRSSASRRGEDDSKSESGMSVRSNFSVAESIYSRAMSRKGRVV